MWLKKRGLGNSVKMVDNLNRYMFMGSSGKGGEAARSMILSQWYLQRPGWR